MNFKEQKPSKAYCQLLRTIFKNTEKLQMSSQSWLATKYKN